MDKFVYIVLVVMVILNCCIVAWVLIKNAESDEKYEKELDRIYGRKR
jgi:hypothetical protein